ncbi:MAG: trigger factor [Solirubrobacterales bacterium]|nr:trigger factor [Solirubrobacterales bacterium]
MQTTVDEQAGSRVRVGVTVPPDDVDQAIGRAARSIARDMRLPGFRKGKAPPALVIQRVGFGPVLEDAIREALPEWYMRAVYESGIAPIGDPEVEVTESPTEQGEPLSFAFEIGVRPQASLGDYLGLEVERPEAEVPDEMVDRELDRLRESMARLEPVDRPAAEGDHVLVDFTGRLDGEEFEGGSATGEVIEIGSGRLIPGFEEQLVGAVGGGDVEVEVTFPEDYGAEHLAGKDAAFAVSVSEVREKHLPEADDELAISVSEFETIGELRDDIAQRLSEALSERADQDFRVNVVDAVAEAATIDVPEALAEARARERWERVERQIAGSGMNPDSWLQMQGKTREEVIAESLPDAEREIRREAAVVAVADAEGIEVDDAELLEELGPIAEKERTTPEKLLERLSRDGRDAAIREDIRVRKAIDRLVDSATPVPVPVSLGAEGDEGDDEDGREAGKPESGGKLWTPGDPR